MMNKKSNSESIKKISLAHIAMNPEWAEAFGFVFKLCYDFPKKEEPALEVFISNDETKSNEWHLYGAEDDQSRVVKVEFTTLDEVKELQLSGSAFRIQFVKLSEIEIDYPKVGKTKEANYEFMVESLKT